MEKCSKDKEALVLFNYKNKKDGYNIGFSKIIKVRLREEIEKCKEAYLKELIHDEDKENTFLEKNIKEVAVVED